MTTSTRGKTLHIETSFPTFKEVPKESDEGADTFEVTTRTKVGFPDNWWQLPPKWKAVLLRELLMKIARTFIREDPVVAKEFRKAMGWDEK